MTQYTTFKEFKTITCNIISLIKAVTSFSAKIIQYMVWSLLAQTGQHRERYYWAKLLLSSQEWFNSFGSMVQNFRGSY